MAVPTALLSRPSPPARALTPYVRRASSRVGSPARLRRGGVVRDRRCRRRPTRRGVRPPAAGPGAVQRHGRRRTPPRDGRDPDLDVHVRLHRALRTRMGDHRVAEARARSARQVVRPRALPSLAIELRSRFGHDEPESTRSTARRDPDDDGRISPRYNDGTARRTRSSPRSALHITTSAGPFEGCDVARRDPRAATRRPAASSPTSSATPTTRSARRRRPGVRRLFPSGAPGEPFAAATSRSCRSSARATSPTRTFPGTKDAGTATPTATNRGIATGCRARRRPAHGHAGPALQRSHAVAAGRERGQRCDRRGDEQPPAQRAVQHRARPPRAVGRRR